MCGCEGWAFQEHGAELGASLYGFCGTEYCFLLDRLLSKACGTAFVFQKYFDVSDNFLCELHFFIGKPTNSTFKLTLMTSLSNWLLCGRMRKTAADSFYISSIWFIANICRPALFWINCFYCFNKNFTFTLRHVQAERVSTGFTHAQSNWLTPVSRGNSINPVIIRNKTTSTDMYSQTFPTSFQNFLFNLSRKVGSGNDVRMSWKQFLYP